MIGANMKGTIDRRGALRWLWSGASMALLAACSVAPQAAPTSAPPPAQPTVPAAQPPPTTQPATPLTPTSTAASAPLPRVTPAAAANATAQPTAGGTLRLGMVGDVSTLDGHNTTPNQFDTTWSVFDRLISYDTKLQPQPELAESWDLSTDLTQVKLNSRVTT